MKRILDLWKFDDPSGDDRGSVLRSRVVALLIVWILALVLFLWISPRVTSVLLREFKARIDANHIYGSTVGKAIWNPVFLLISFLLMNAGAKLKGLRERASKGIPAFCAALIVLGTFYLWFKSFSVTTDALQFYHVDPYIDGAHFQACKNGFYFGEVIHPDHPHALKVVAQHLFLKNRFYITGEGFTALYDFNTFWPAVVMLGSLATFLVSLIFLTPMTLTSSFAYAWGYYIIFFSYFDGGLLTGFQGLFFMLLAPAFSKTWPRPRLFAFVVLGLYLLTFAVQGLLQCLFHLVRHSFTHPALILTDIRHFASAVTYSRLTFCLLLLAATLRTQTRRLAWMFLLSGILVYAGNFYTWRHIRDYGKILPAHQKILVNFYSGVPVPDTKSLLRFKNAQIVLAEVKKRETVWDFCRDALASSEGLSYRSLAVSIYCAVMSDSEGTRGKRAVAYRVLEHGKCDCQMDDELKNYVSIQKKDPDHGIFRGFSDISPNGIRVRTLGVPFCLEDTVLLVSRPYHRMRKEHPTPENMPAETQREPDAEGRF